MTLTERQNTLFEFVKEKHGDQKRKYTGEPYWTHLLSVAEIVSNHNIHLGVEIALCHDLVEDTECTYSSLVDFLIKLYPNEGDYHNIVGGVYALTDLYTPEAFPKLNRLARKEKESCRLSKIYADYQSVKLADLIDNTSSIVKYDKGFAKKYLPEKKMILDKMRAGNIDLYIEACYVWKCAMIELEKP